MPFANQHSNPWNTAIPHPPSQAFDDGFLGTLPSITPLNDQCRDYLQSGFGSTGEMQPAQGLPNANETVEFTYPNAEHRRLQVSSVIPPASSSTMPTIPKQWNK